MVALWFGLPVVTLGFGLLVVTLGIGFGKLILSVWGVCEGVRGCGGEGRCIGVY